MRQAGNRRPANFNALQNFGEINFYMNSKVIWLAAGLITGAALMVPFVHPRPVSVSTVEPAAGQPLPEKTPPNLPAAELPVPVRQSTALTLYEEIAACGESDLLSLAKKILALPDSPMRRAALDLLMESWVQIDFKGALNFANKLPANDRALAFKSALLKLGSSRFDEALSWVDANYSIALRQEAGIWLYCGLAMTNPQNALARLQQLPNSQLKQNATYSILSQWAETDVYGALAWLKEAPRDSRTADAYRRLMDVYIAKHPDQALDFVSTMEGADYWKGRYTKDIVVKIVGTDPQKALQLADSITDSTVQAEAYKELFSQWGTQDSAAALNQALQMSGNTNLDGATRNDIIRDSALGMLNQDRSQLLAKFDVIPPEIRMEITEPLVTQWMEENPGAALQWTEKLGTDHPDYDLAMSAIINSYGQSDPEKAISLAGKIKDQATRETDVYRALQNLYRQNPPQAEHLSASPSLVPTVVAAAFDNWIKETGAKESIFVPAAK